MKATVTRAVFDTEFGLEVKASRDSHTRARGPQATDFPSDLVAAIRDWADAGLQGIHEDYRVPARLVEYLNEVIADGGESTRAVVAHTVLGLLNMAPEGGN